MTIPASLAQARRLLDRLILGETMKEAAFALGIQHCTARQHLMYARERVQANTTYQLIAMYVREGR